MRTEVTEEREVEAREGLAALQDAWNCDGSEAHRTTQRVSKPRILDLHLIPQLTLADAAKAFSCLDKSFPVQWKQQVRQLRNRLTRFDEEVKERDQAGLQVISLLSLDGQRPRKGLAGNLAFALAAMEETKVLLIDAKVSAPDLHLQLGLSAAGGLCAATRVQREDLPYCFRRVAGTQLYMLPLGQTTRHDGDAVDLRGMQRLLMGLRQQFDWIILDGPGFDTPADATLVTLCADASLYLVEQGVDRFEDLRLALKQTQGRYMVGTVMI